MRARARVVLISQVAHKMQREAEILGSFVVAC